MNKVKNVLLKGSNPPSTFKLVLRTPEYSGTPMEVNLPQHVLSAKATPVH
jgi:hypothetical protein